MHDRVRYQLRQSAAVVGRLKDVLKNPSEIDPRDLVRKYRHRSVAKIERPDIVQAKDMIDMTMRDQHRIKPADVRPQSLLAKVA
jgi:hypothetical protein